MKKLLCALLLLSLPGLRAAEPTPIPTGVTCELIGTYDLARLDTILTTERAVFSDYPVTYPPAKNAVKLYRITYPSIIPEQQNRPTLATGLLALPDIPDHTLPVLSYQHGTVFSKTEVPSHPDQSIETRLILARFASQGYLVIAADYFGKGLSPETDSYLVKASTQQACLDHLHAARAATTQLGHTWGPLFLSGWSQGGWATLAFLNKLENVGHPVRAAAIASAPTDVYAIINGWLHSPTPRDAIYLPGVLALQIHATAAYHSLPGLPAAAIRPEYQQVARDLYLNKIDWTTAAALLPAKAAALLREDFTATSDLGVTPYWQIVRQAQSYRWRSHTPLRTYYGQIDEVTSPYIATLPVGYQQAIGGAEAQGHDAGPQADHRGTFLHALADQKPWFDELLKK